MMPLSTWRSRAGSFNGFLAGIALFFLMNTPDVQEWSVA